MGKRLRRASPPHQASLQKLILLPSPRAKTAFWRKIDHYFLISFHKLVPKPPLRSLVFHPPVDSPNLQHIVFLHNAFCSLANLQLHLYNKALFSLEKLFKPIPPLLFAEHTVAHFTKEIFFSRALPPPPPPPPPLPEELPLNSFQSRAHFLRHTKKREVIYREAGQSATDKRDPTALRDILILPSSQPLLVSHFNRVPDPKSLMLGS